jgi:dienelactone hydrolase
MLSATFALSLVLLAQPADFQKSVADALAKPVLGEGQTRAEWKRFVATRIPALAYPSSAEEWTAKSEALRKAFLDKVVYRGVPSEWRDSPVMVEWVGDIDTDKDYRIRKLRYQAVPGLWISALLYEPKTITGKAPAVLNVNGHVGPPGKGIEYEQIRCINLAKRGVLALHPEWLNFGELQGSRYDHNSLSYLDLCGVSGLSVFYNAMKRGLDVLCEYPSTDLTRVGMTGLSGGGWQTILLSSLDTRITLTAPNAGYSGLAERIDYTQDIGDLEQVPNDILTVGDYQHLTAMLAPRPALLIYNDRDNCCFETYRAKPSIYDPIVPFYMAYGKADSFAIHNNVDPGTHNYDLDNRQQFYRFLNKHWALGTSDTELPFDGELRKPEELYAGLPQDNATFPSLAEGLMKDLPAGQAPIDKDPAAKNAWMESKRNALNKILHLPSFNATAAQTGNEDAAGISVTRYRINCGEFTVPVVTMVTTGSTPKELVIVLNDAGRAASAERALKAIQAGARVVALDPTYLGESSLHATSAWQYSMFFHATGERLLGQQTAQIAAVAAWARNEFKPESLRAAANGWNTSVAALCAGVLHPELAMVCELENAPTSLKQLITEKSDQRKLPALFCFGLLKAVDISELVAITQESVKSATTGLDITVALTLDEDLGQRLGSIFEARDSAGRVRFGAGFDDAHSTYMRDNNRQLVFFCATRTSRAN